MSMKLVTAIVLGISIQAVFAQRAAERRIVPPPTAPPKSGPIYMDAYATPDPEGPTVHCSGKGIKCAVDASLLTAARPTPVHDATLQEATAAVNRVLSSLTPPRDRKLCLFRSVYGPVLLWVKTGAAPDQPGPDRLNLRAAPQRIEDPQAIANLLGLRPAAGLAAGNRKAELVWDNEIKTYFWKCPSQGTDCVIHKLTTAAARTASHDESLSKATEEINRILERAAAKAPRPEQSLCILFTPDGPMLAWTFSRDIPGRTVSSDSPEYRRAAREALGLDARGN